MLAAVVAAGGLGVTAYGTFVSARVAEDQLNQSKVQNEERTMRQASRVNMWGEGKYEVIANRSLDPAYAWVIMRDGSREYPVVAGTLPPCTRVSIATSNLEEAIIDFVPKPHAKARRHSMSPAALWFVDTDGRAWRRDYQGGGLRPMYEPLKAVYAISNLVAKEEPLDECGAAS
ncbi:hypothetical protein OOK44_36620 [Streptomyces cellulosae]|uniref:hypothetical protein n=1 Tax=Streptomyces cellulosae TaxID=1968 RepID=UPI00225355D1|nr:hypothetical protein [Streptomyces cellulosae]WTC60981.1 hypothetical protein OH715_37300 [Streptomyces cellulosae]